MARVRLHDGATGAILTDRPPGGTEARNALQPLFVAQQ